MKTDGRWVEIWDATQEIVLADRAEVASSFWKLLVGVIPYRRLSPGQGMVLPSTGSIHTWGVRFPVDVLFLDRENKVLGRRAQVRPFRVAIAPRGCHTAIELPAGAIGSVDVGDHIMVRPCAAPGRALVGSGAQKPTE